MSRAPLSDDERDERVADLQRERLKLAEEEEAEADRDPARHEAERRNEELQYTSDEIKRAKRN